MPLERKPYLERATIELCLILFLDLDFTQQPVKAQPKLCLVNYLRARRLEAHLANPREQIEKAVAQCRHIGKPVQSPPLPPIAGQHDGFIAIKTQVGDNEYDNWNRNYCDLAKKLKPIDYDVVDGLLGEKRVDRPAIRKRVQRLFNGGFYDPKSIKCKNVESKADGR